MAVTPRGYPYPALTDAPSGPTQMQALAQAVDTDMQAVADARTPVSVKRVRASSASIAVDDSTVYQMVFYNQGVTYDQDPHDYLDYASGLFTLKAAGLWGWELSLDWPDVPSGTPQHHRDLYIYRNGGAQSDGRTDIPYPSGAWSSKSAQTQGAVNAALNDTIQAVFYQNSGSRLTATGAVFTVWLIALAP